jgi:hypothetical protein
MGDRLKRKAVATKARAKAMRPPKIKRRPLHRQGLRKKASSKGEERSFAECAHDDGLNAEGNEERLRQRVAAECEGGKLSTGRSKGKLKISEKSV